MKEASKFIVISVGGLLLLMVIGMIVSSCMNLNPEKMRNVDLINDWMLYRIAAYLLIILVWEKICKILTRKRIRLNHMDEKDMATYELKQQHDIQVLVRQRWKVAAVFIFLEVVIVQQFGL